MFHIKYRIICISLFVICLTNTSYLSQNKREKIENLPIWSNYLSMLYVAPAYPSRTGTLRNTLGVDGSYFLYYMYNFFNYNHINNLKNIIQNNLLILSKDIFIDEVKKNNQITENEFNNVIYFIDWLVTKYLDKNKIYTFVNDILKKNAKDDKIIFYVAIINSSKLKINNAHKELQSQEFSIVHKKNCEFYWMLIKNESKIFKYMTPEHPDYKTVIQNLKKKDKNGILPPYKSHYGRYVIMKVLEVKDVKNYSSQIIFEPYDNEDVNIFVNSLLRKWWKLNNSMKYVLFNFCLKEAMDDSTISTEKANITEENEKKIYECLVHLIAYTKLPKIIKKKRQGKLFTIK